MINSQQSKLEFLRRLATGPPLVTDPPWWFPLDSSATALARFSEMTAGGWLEQLQVQHDPLPRIERFVLVHPNKPIPVEQVRELQRRWRREESLRTTTAWVVTKRTRRCLGLSASTGFAPKEKENCSHDLLCEQGYYYFCEHCEGEWIGEAVYRSKLARRRNEPVSDALLRLPGGQLCVAECVGQYSTASMRKRLSYWGRSNLLVLLF